MCIGDMHTSPDFTVEAKTSLAGYVTVERNNGSSGDDICVRLNGNYDYLRGTVKPGQACQCAGGELDPSASLSSQTQMKTITSSRGKSLPSL